MKQYTTTGVVDVYAGLVGLSDGQARDRAHNLKPVKKGVFEVVVPIQFKAGETIGLAKPDKAILTRLSAVKKTGAGK